VSLSALFFLNDTDFQIQRMQSRLSERSAQGHRSKRFLPVLSPVSKNDRKSSISTPFGISRIRERAGSVFSRKKPETAPGQDTPTKSQLKKEQREREWERRGTHETGETQDSEGEPRSARMGSGSDPRRPGEEGGMENTGSKAGVGEDENLRAPDMLGGPPEPPRV
jgi:hypothetical protein